MGKAGRIAASVLVALDLLGAGLYAISYATSGLAQTRAMSRLSYFEHAGAIDANVLAKLPDPGFATDPRGAFLERMGFSRDAQESNARDGLVFCAVNLAMVIIVLATSMRGNASSDGRKSEGASGTV